MQTCGNVQNDVHRTVNVCALVDPDDRKPAKLQTQLIIVLSSLIPDAFPIFNELAPIKLSKFGRAMEELPKDMSLV